MMASQIETFWQEYYRQLVASIEAAPADYALRPGESAQGYASATAAKMQRAVERDNAPDFGKINYRDSKAFRAAAKSVWVPFTRDGMNSIYRDGE